MHKAFLQPTLDRGVTRIAVGAPQLGAGTALLAIH
jgi:hypothetical protein